MAALSASSLREQEENEWMQKKKKQEPKFSSLEVFHSFSDSSLNDTEKYDKNKP